MLRFPFEQQEAARKWRGDADGAEGAIQWGWLHPLFHAISRFLASVVSSIPSPRVPLELPGSAHLSPLFSKVGQRCREHPGPGQP
jgi:hypothetical protein